MQPSQLPLFAPERARPFSHPFPSTRYQGSKRSLVEWIWGSVCHLSFDTVLDVFGGTGAVSHLFKNAGKQVIFNDNLEFNWNIGLALIENTQETLSDADLQIIFEHDSDIEYPGFIQKTFNGIYFTEDENRWLDRIVHNIDRLSDGHYKRALARFCLFQACIVKRPYNLFHRANLYMRLAAVERSFGNKVTWDTPFEAHFRAFAKEANRAVFDNGCENRAVCLDALETPTGADLVYIDPPYLNAKGTGVDYREFYHFLEGMADYESWQGRIDWQSKHRRLQPQKSAWNKPKHILDAFGHLIERHRKSTLLISYRDDGIPGKSDLVQLLNKNSKQVTEIKLPIKYALAHKQSHELLLIAI